MQTETLTYILLSGIIALVLALFQYILNNKKRTRLHWLLSSLRFLSIFAVLLLLVNPKFDSVSFFDEKANLVIAVDNSESVAFLKQDKKVNDLIERLRSDQDLNEKFNVEFYAFGNTFRSMDSLSFDERQSNVADAFDKLSEIYNTNSSPAILISDGNQTYGRDYEFSSNVFKHPIFPVILGDTTTFTDIKIQQLNVNRYVYLKNKFPVEIIATYNGNTAVDTRLQVTSGNAVVYSQPLSFSPNNNSKIIEFTLPANRVGVKTFKAEIEVIASEKNTINNIKNFGVEIIDQKTNVAIVSDMTHPDLGALKKAIESNEQRSANILSVNEFLNTSEDYQMVVAYQPNNKFRAVLEETERLKLNKWVVAGNHTSWSIINQLQNNYNQKVTNQKENFQGSLNPNYNPFIVEEINFNDLPPLESEFGETVFNIPFETILFKTINGTQIDEPLLATFELNDKREALLNGEGIWKWRAQSYLERQSFNDFDNLVGKIVQYLSSKQRRSRLNVNYESFYNGNENVKLTAQYFNKNYEFDANVNLIIELTNSETNDSTSYPFVLKNNNFEVDLSGLAAGEYTFSVRSSEGNISRSGTIKILEYNVEQQFLNANVTKLQNLANSSEGSHYFIDDTSNLINELLTDSRFVTVQKSSKKVVPLIDWKYLLAIIVFCLAAEWFIRKYNGLI
ncbi:MAG: VWA domain-containing protein [Psychroserpens sp.]|nr:VWA domain-containing protein [Psychroserpens sp.]